MSGEQLTGQDTPAVTGEVTPPEVAQVQATSPEIATQGDEGEQPPAAAKSFTQEELNEIVRKEKAKAEAKAERRVMRTLEKVIPQQVQQVQQPIDDRPHRSQYANDESFVDALTDWKLDQREMGQRQQQQRQQSETLNQKTEKIYAEAEKVPGFDREAFDELPLTPVIAHALTDSDVAAKLMVFMAANPAEVERITALSPARQAAEIGKLESKLASAPTVKAPRTPAPIEPVGSSNGSSIKNLASMSADEYYATRMKQKPVWARR